MQRVYTASSLPDAHLVLHLLRAAGIDSIVLNENAAGALGDIPFSFAMPQVWVTDRGYAQRAAGVIEAWLHRVPSAHSRPCGLCGEDNPDEFEVCWRCGCAFPADSTA